MTWRPNTFEVVLYIYMSFPPVDTSLAQNGHFFFFFLISSFCIRPCSAMKGRSQNPSLDGQPGKRSSDTV